MMARALMLAVCLALAGFSEGAATTAPTATAAPVAATAAAPPTLVTPESKTTGMARRLASAPLLYGHFVQEKAIKGLKKPLISRGDFLVAKDKGVIWRTQKPFVAAVAVTPKGIWSVKGGGTGLDPNEEVPVPKRSPIHQGNLGATMGMIQKVLGGDAMGLGKAFKVLEGGSDSAWTLRLEPKDAVMARFIQSVTLAGGAHVDSVVYMEANGDATRIAFSGVAKGGGALAPWIATVLRD